MGKKKKSLVTSSMPEYTAYEHSQIDPHHLPGVEAWESQSSKTGTIKSFLSTYYREKKTASEVTVDMAQSLFWTADLVDKWRYSIHFSMNSGLFC